MTEETTKPFDPVEGRPTDFIREAVAEDLRTGRFNYVRTRLPPEPNGYLHIGHVKAWMIDYLVAKDFNGELILRFDDTNPTKEETEFVDAIMEDTRWLGVEWKEVTYASDYFTLLYDWAIQLVKKGLAYVDDQSPEEVKANRGNFTEPGKESPYRNRSVEENLDLLERMKDGEFPDGSRVLRAKIDMSHPNLNMIPLIIAQETNGTSTLCTTGPTDKTTRWKGSRIPCVRLNIAITVRFTTGSMNSWRFSNPGRSSLHVLI
jgi:glutaminyl-tRNA synthetase